MLREPDHVVLREIGVTSRDTLIIRNISALLDLAGQPQSVHHRETIDTVRSFVGSLLLENGMTQESLLDLSRSLSTSQLTRLSLRIPDTAVDQLPWEYLEIGDPPQRIRRGPLALNKCLLIERRVKPDDPPLPPKDEIPVDQVMLIGTPTAETSVAAMEAVRQDLGNLKIKVDPPEAGGGRTYGEISLLPEWPPVLMLLASVRRVKDRQVVEIQLEGPGEKGWIEAQDVYDVFQFSGKTFRAIIIESFATEPGDDSQGATAELASSFARRGLGNIIFLCHPPAFSGYERHVAGPATRTFAGHLIAALNAKATVPHAFYVARNRMQTAFYQRCGQTFGIPGLYIPEYAEEPQVESESSRLAVPSVSRRAERHAGPVSPQPPKDGRSLHRDDDVKPLEPKSWGSA